MRLRGRFAVPFVPSAIIASSLLIGCGGGSVDRVYDDGNDTGAVDSGAIDSGKGDSAITDAHDTGLVDSGIDTAVVDSTPPDVGPPTEAGTVSAISPVAGGTISASENYRLITTNGQIAGGSVLSSSSYTLKGGFVSISQP